MEVARYLFARLHDLGVRSLFGTPGDYNLVALDFLEDAGLRWVGNSNELNAGYAADGYGRIKGIAALITVFGVGELSAINAIAGAYAERSPVVHIVGTPSTSFQSSGLCLHHSLGNGDFRVFANMYTQITVAHTNLSDITTVASEIDRVLKACVHESRPVYIELPTDMVSQTIPTSEAMSNGTLIQSNGTLHAHWFEDSVVDIIREKITSAQRPFIIVDGLVRAYDIEGEVNAIVRSSNIPTSTTPAGKSMISEQAPNVCRLYKGTAGDPEYSAYIKTRDLLIYFAPLWSDCNTFGFSTIHKDSTTIVFHQDAVTIRGKEFRIQVKSLLQKLLESMSDWKCQVQVSAQCLMPDVPTPDVVQGPESQEPIKQSAFWRLCSQVLTSGDVVLTECGTSSIGAYDLVLPEDVRMVTSALWLSIGFMLGAAQGSALAIRDLVDEGIGAAGRTILFTGDGSLQMSVQAISDIIRNRLDMIIIIINNDGYTIERHIHGMYAQYNDVQPWRYLEAPNFFGANLDDPTYPITLRKGTTWGDIIQAFEDPAVRSGKGLIMIEVVMAKEDAPETLKNLFK
ncbi:Pyruvate decarboxylase [Cyphellophora attinorum]|uniref:Pyruvate decarboxylase n=1 Tax=Cyphellophora attinorum TaxID=1664694 RepID=A0A0N1H2S9_9EURO|nr:Pyruvate decarboxylase [Phialophora attinorum]KPI34820.1 Pyruvate decarboxylase [Phialophora attinorum]